MTTLYRKYRPQSFSDLTGQEHIVQTVMNEIALGKVAQAYLFSGPRGVGKTTLARLLAKAVNCPSRKAGTSEPCGACSSCQEIASGRNIDVIEIDAASHTGVDNVRENIIESAQFKPTKSPYKIFIIDEVHMLSTSAFNALLKTLEEPPSHVIFVLATTELNKLPATIISRCQRFQFAKIPYETMRDRLKSICKQEAVKVAKEVIDRVIAKSDGCLRDAESLLGQLMSLVGSEITAADAERLLPSADVGAILTLIEQVTEGSAKDALETIAKLAENGQPFEQIMSDTAEVLRSLLIIQTAGEVPLKGADFSDDTLHRLRKLAPSITQEHLIQLIDQALKRRLDIKFSPLPYLPLELWAVEGTETAKILPTAPPAARAETPKEIAEPEEKKHHHSIKDSLKSALSTITGHRSVSVTFGQIKSRWNEVMTAIGVKNHSLAFILSMAALDKLDGDTLNLSVPYSLHREKLIEIKNRQIIEGCCAEIFGEPIRLACSVTPSPRAATELDQLAVEFGGEVIS